MPETVLLDHGAGGRLAHDLTTNLMLPIFDNAILSDLNDGAIFDLQGVRLAFSTDTYTVDPIFFPGGNIGELAVNGTVNDIAMCGGTPLYLSAGLIVEEGLNMNELTRILRSMGAAAQRAGVKIVTGDTKVVPRGVTDRILINTSGIGVIPEGIGIGSNKARTGDMIILSGTIADHGIAILAQREGLALETTVMSDTAPLNRLVGQMFEASKDIHVLRDPTRGGVGTALNEIAERSSVGIMIWEERLPLRDDVAGVCELLGLDPIYLANEGKLLAFVAADDAEHVLAAMQQEPYGQKSCIIGEVLPEHPGRVVMETRMGGTRIVDMLTGEQFPRIC